jgi:negative regulator of sigma E activity
MSDHKFESRLSETLSAFLDGEASPEEMHALLQELERDPRLHMTVDHHHRMRASLRGELHPGLDAGFAERVLAGIEAVAGGIATAESKVVHLPARRSGQPWTRAVLGMAMAASLTAVVVLAAQRLLPPAESVLPTSNMTAQARAAVTPAPAAGIELASQARRASQPWNDLSPDAAAELNNYLISHNNSAMDHGFSGTMGFMRVAADDGLYSGGADR